MKLTMLVEVDCSEYVFSVDDDEAVEWFGQKVLMNTTDDGALYLHSNEVGDTLGRVKVLTVHNWPPKKKPSVEG